MDSKGQKFNSYTPEFRNKIVSKYFNENRSAIFLFHEYGVSKGTIKG